jgi:hypothetical protein
MKLLHIQHRLEHLLPLLPAGSACGVPCLALAAGKSS